jgi:hypothetical protein
VTLDVTAALLALCVTYGVLRLRGTVVLSTAVSVGVLALIVIIVTLGLMARSGQYTNRRRMSALADVGGLFRDILIATAVATLLSYLTKGFFTGDQGSRLAVGSFLLAFFVLGLASRLALRRYEKPPRPQVHGLSGEPDVLEQGERGKNVRALERARETEVGAPVFGNARHVLAAEQDTPRRRCDRARQEIDKGRLAGPVRPDDGVQLAPRERERDIADGGEPPERIRERASLEQEL